MNLFIILNIGVIGISYIISLYVYYLSVENSLIALIFWLSAICFSLLIIFNNKQKKIELPIPKRLGHFIKSHWAIIIPFITGFVVRLYAINTIPFMTHDEAKDAGFFPLKILHGQLKDYFGFNAGINNIFFVLSTIPHFIVSNPILQVRLFAVVFGSLSVVVIYFVVGAIISKQMGMAAAFLLAFYHVHIHFSRTEFLNVFDSFYTLVITLAFTYYIKKKDIQTALFTGFILGFGLHFYSGLRVIIASTMFIFTGYTLIRFPIAKSLLLLICFFSLFIVAFGPTILVFQERNEEALAMGTAKITTNKIAANYIKSLEAYTKREIDFHYKYGGPFISFPFSILFYLGIITLLLHCTNPSYLLIFMLLFTIPFFNSALLNDINFTHRLLGLVSVIILTITIGLDNFNKIVSKILHKRMALIAIFLIIGFFALYNMRLYFINNSWENALHINELRAWEAQKIINRENLKTTQVFFFGNDYMPSYKSTPPLDYLTKTYNRQDVLSKSSLIQKITCHVQRTDLKTILVLVVQDEQGFVLEKDLEKAAQDYEIISDHVYFKSTYLFDTLTLRKNR